MHGWDRRHRFDPDIKALLLIAGLSGCGKSTFIKQLRKKKLPAELARLLPPDIQEWRHAYGKKSLKDVLLPGRKRIPPGQIFHFDMTTSSAYRRAVAEHRPEQAPDISKPHPDEETLNAALAAAERIHILVVKPQKEQLVRQLSGRAAVIDLPPPLRPIASRTVPLLHSAKNFFRSRKSGKLREHLGGRWTRRAQSRNKSYRNCEFYSRQGVIDAVHDDWESSICTRIGNRLAAPTAYIEPVPGTLWRRNFRPLNTAPDAAAAAAPHTGSFTRLENLASLLDNAIAIPGTRLSFGIDAIVGLVPIIGDAISGTVAGFIIWEARRLGAPRGMLARMIANATFDTLIGVIPLVGDVADAAYKSNVRNVTMLRRHLAGMSLMRGAVTA